MHCLFLCNPPETFIPHKDSTRVLMQEAARRGLQVFAAGHYDLEARGKQIFAWARPLTFGNRPWFSAGPAQVLYLNEAHSIWFRHDPPFDAAYLHATRLIDLVVGPQKINAPSGLRYANEKLLALEFTQFTPATLLSNNLERIRAFLADVGGKGVVKPLDGFGGDGIFIADLGDPNLNAILQMATANGAAWTLVQAYIAAAAEGDMRVLLMDGKIIGQFLRVPKPGEFRGNMAQGGSVRAVAIDARVQAIVDAVAPRLRELGLRLVGLDVVGGFLTEINVTSPTGFQEVKKLSGQQPERAVWDALL